MRRFGGACVLVLFAITVVPAGHAWARPKSFSLNWVRDPDAEGCITSGALARVIESMFGPVFVAPSEAAFAIEGRIWPLEHEGGFRARISVTDRGGARLGVRELSNAAPSCRSFDAAIALVIAMSIDPELGVEQLPPELLDSLSVEADPGAALLAELRSGAVKESVPARQPLAAGVELPAPVAAPQPRAAGESRPPEATELSAQLEAGYAAGLAVLPQLSSGPLVGVALSVSPRWSFALRGVLWLPNDALLAEPNPRELAVPISMVLTSLSACFSGIRSSALVWDACGGVANGVRWSDASALQTPSDVTTVDVGPMLSSQVRLRVLDPFELRASIAAYAPLQRQGFTYRELANREQELFTPGRVQGWAWIAAAIAL
jgi:hypothetical protein